MQLVIGSVESTALDEFVNLFAGDYYIDPRMVANAIARRSIFNLIHNQTILKVDCIVLKNDEYRREEFARRRKVNLGDFETWIVSREDLIISKLFWARDSKSELQLRDVKNLLAADCDNDYLSSRAEKLGVKDLLNEVRAAHE